MEIENLQEDSDIFYEDIKEINFYIYSCKKEIKKYATKIIKIYHSYKKKQKEKFGLMINL